MKKARGAFPIFAFVVAAAVAIVCQASAQSKTGGTVRADKIVVQKSNREMTLFSDGKPIKTYKISLGRQPQGAKEREGDHKTPEGHYIIDAKIEQSRFHRALHISYPNEADRERARKLGVNPGGAVEIHGLGDGFGWVGALHREVDWTDGCIAVTNGEIDGIWPMVAVGTSVDIRP
ncbi:MAG TPA: L,D-transpeptidase family protein [Candidatus Acidoferrales bacterium]|nr:L,D-transpeptidase family protein [Candidatus Acidoferrales bacterium]